MNQTNELLDETGGNKPKVFDEERSKSKIKVLAVDDDPPLLDLTGTYLERERDEFSVETANSGPEALDVFQNEEFDAIVSDYEMPEMNGLELLGEIREINEEIPFILFTGKGSEEIASEAISKGVTDYLQKKSGASQYSILANRLVNAVEQYRASRALARSQEKFSKLVMNSTDVIAIVNDSGQFKYISPACEHVLGYKQEELIGEIAFDYMPPDDRQSAMEEFFAALENPDREPTIEFRFEKPDGGWTVIEARGKNMFEDDFINGFVVNGRDVSVMKEHKQELKQQNEQLKNMRNVITHDLRNPLNVGSGALELYRETGDESYLDKIANAFERMEVLLEQILTLTDESMEGHTAEQVSLREVVRDAWEMVETDSGVLQIDDSKELEADRVRLQQVFENLIRNAIEHGGEDVSIQVGTTESSIYFEDSGPGIPEDKRDEVFETGFTTNEENTGYGLTIVKQIILGHGWDIEVNEGEDGGARFEISGVTFQPTVYS